MAYKMHWPVENLNWFHADGSTTENDLVKLTFENGQCLYVTLASVPDFPFHNPGWHIDNALLPVELTELKEQQGTSVSIFGITEGRCRMGNRLHLEMVPTSYWKDSLYFITESPITSLKPVRRPRQVPTLHLAGKAKVETSSDYH